MLSTERASFVEYVLNIKSFLIDKKLWPKVKVMYKHKHTESKAIAMHQSFNPES